MAASAAAFSFDAELPALPPLTAQVIASDKIGIAWLPESVARWSWEIGAAGRSQGVDPALLAILVLIESGGRQGAVSSAGAFGLGQLMPGTAADIERRTGLPCTDRANSYVNVQCAAWYMRGRLERYGSVERAGQAYNAGDGRIDDYLAGRDTLPAESEKHGRYLASMYAERNLETSGAYARYLAGR